MILGNVQTGDKIPNTSLPSTPHEAAVAAGSLKNANGVYHQSTFKAIFSLDINIDGWIWKGNPHTISYDTVQFHNIDATVGETLFIIHSPNNNIVPGGYTVFTYLARHYIQRDTNDQDRNYELTLTGGTFEKDIGNGKTAVLNNESTTIVITGGADKSFNYKIKNATGVVVSKE